MIDFRGKNALVTGGDRGIGEAIAKGLLELDCRVTVTSRGEPPAWIKGYPLAEHIKVDFLDVEGMAGFLEKLEQEERLDVLVNNAGIHIPEAVYDLTDGNFDKVLKVNLYAPARIMKVASNKMKKQRSGKIVNVSSMAGIVSKPGSTAYSASKSGLIGLTRASALALAPFNVLVNAICPGHTQTEMVEMVLTAEQKEQFIRNIPFGRFASPEEIANFAVFLCSDLNTYITGQTVVVDGGVTIK
ncbi:MAG: SDR family oxidoreductase [Candidatus Margulisbacteria bacterium]|nr:SDR family oxidoreductase [Candidatus Margulisiibacteriota bacterium]MBU1617110.1 SDR family oxidoreductase [Candidatus Margulisiibacteriota bacterium]